MPATVSSPEANRVAVQALYAQGKSTREIAQILGMDRSTAWRLRHQVNHDQETIQHASKSIADRLLLVASHATDTVLDKAESGELDELQPKQLVDMAANALRSAGEYAALSGAKDLMTSIMSDYGIESSHSSSRLTLTKQLTIEQTPQPVVIEATKQGLPRHEG